MYHRGNLEEFESWVKGVAIFEGVRPDVKPIAHPRKRDDYIWLFGDHPDLTKDIFTDKDVERMGFKIAPVVRFNQAISKAEVLTEVTENPDECIEDMMVRKGITDKDDEVEFCAHMLQLEKEGKVKGTDTGPGSTTEWERI